MRLGLASHDFLCFEDLKQSIRTLHSPALLVDKSFKIVAKSDDLADSKSFRIGARFDRLLKPSDADKLYFLEEGRMFVADLVGNGHAGYATVVCGKDCYLVCFRYLADSISNRIAERFSGHSGYDVGVNAYITAVMTDVGNTENGKRLSRVIERLLLELSDVHKLSFFDFSATASAFFFALGEVAPSLARRIDIPKTLPETVALGCGDDMLLIAAYALSLCFDCSDGGRVGFFAVDRDGGIKITFSCDSDGKTDGISSFVNAINGRSGFGKALDVYEFWAFFVKLIADTNLWEISASAVGNAFELSVFMPSVARGEEFSVRDTDPLSMLSVLQYFFGK